MTAMPTVLEKRPFRDFTEQLHSVPVRNALARLVRERSDERKEVYAVRQKYSGIARLLKGVLKLRDEKMYELSGIGLRIFRALGPTFRATRAATRPSCSVAYEPDG